MKQQTTASSAHIFSKQAISTLSRDSAPTILLVAPHVLEIELVSSMWSSICRISFHPMSPKHMLQHMAIF